MKPRVHRWLASLRGNSSNLMVLTGAGVLAAGFFVLAVWAGLMVAGALLLAFGWTMDTGETP